MNIKLVVVLAVIAVCNGCSNPQDANETNFKNSVQAYLDKEYPKCYYIQNFPVTTEHMFSNEELLRLLAKLGILEEKETGGKKQDVSKGWSFNNDKYMIPIYSYNLTEEGRKYYNLEAGTGINGKVGGFCLGKAKVSAIDQFTEPSDMMGEKVSRVIYHYSVAGFPEWAKDEQIKSVLKELKADVESENNPKKEVGDLILTNKGWVLSVFLK
jgi:hypothetical protein